MAERARFQTFVEVLKVSRDAAMEASQALRDVRVDTVPMGEKKAALKLANAALGGERVVLDSDGRFWLAEGKSGKAEAKPSKGESKGKSDGKSKKDRRAAAGAEA